MTDPGRWRSRRGRIALAALAATAIMVGLAVAFAFR